METTKNKISPYATHFFKRLSNYLDTQIYFFGSVQRNDYFPQSSDIDADIFTDNIHSTIIKIQSFLNVNKYNFKKFVYKLNKTNVIVYGYKLKYKDYNNNFFTEFSIYNNKDKDHVLLEHNSKIYIPFYVTILLIIIKFLYYNIKILPNSIYLYLKKIIMNYMVEGKDVEFSLVDVSYKDFGY
jgi:predicted nucleotidyltransferase